MKKRKVKRKFNILFSTMAIIVIALTLASCGNDKVEVYSLKDMNTSSYHLGLLPGTTADYQAQKKIPNCSFEYLNSNSDAQAAVLSGKIDGYAFDSTNLERFVNASGNVELLDVTLGKAFIYAQFKKGNTELTEAFNAFVKKLRSDGTMEKMERYWIDDCSSQMPDLSDLKPDETSGTIVIATEALCEPYTFVGDHGTVIGFDIELGTRFAYYLGMEVKVDNMTFNALMPALASGKADMALCEISSPSENIDSPDVDFSEPYKECETAIVVKKAETGFMENIKNRFIASFITDHRWQLMVNGLLMTMYISIVAFILGAIWGGALCAMKRSGKGPLVKFEKAYSTLAMGMPIMIVLLIFYYIVFAAVSIPASIVAIIAFALTEGAVFCSMYDTGISSVDPQQQEAALALGFRPSEAFRRIVLPQAAKTIYPLFCNEFTSLIKATAIVGYIAISDLTKASDIIRSRSFDAFFPMISTAIIYFLIIYISVIALRKLGNKTIFGMKKNTLKLENSRGIEDTYVKKEQDKSRPVISVRSLSKSYGENVILENITKDVYPGEIISIIGPSGCGKSTFIRCCNRMTDATGGTVIIDGEDIYAEGADVCVLRQKMGMVFQSYNLFPHMSVLENVMLAPVKIKGINGKSVKAKAMELLKIVGMEAHARSYPDSLSGGQKQRVAIARALAMDPEIILFDEPTSALDPNMSVEVFSVIKTLADKGITMIVVTHSMDFARSVSTRVFYMDERGVYEDDMPEIIFSSPAGEKTRDFIYRNRTYTTTCTLSMDLYGMQTEISEFLSKRVITRKIINSVNLLIEEILYNLLFIKDSGAEVELKVRYSDVTGNAEVELYSSLICERLIEEYRDNEENRFSREIVSNLTADFVIEKGMIQIQVRTD